METHYVVLLLCNLGRFHVVINVFMPFDDDSQGVKHVMAKKMFCEMVTSLFCVIQQKGLLY
jgi:hypothetical protein